MSKKEATNYKPISNLRPSKRRQHGAWWRNYLEY